MSARVDGSNRVVALDAMSGDVIWTAQEPRAVDAEAAPAAVGSLVYTPGTSTASFMRWTRPPDDWPGARPSAATLNPLPRSWTAWCTSP